MVLNLRVISFNSLSHYSMHPVDTFFTIYLRVYDSPRTDANAMYYSKKVYAIQTCMPISMAGYKPCYSLYAMVFHTCRLLFNTVVCVVTY